MLTLYSLFTQAYAFIILAASPFNAKAKKWVEGRKNWEEKLKTLQLKNSKVVWVHAASLGEAEQGLPLISLIKKNYPSYQIVLTFFSPSGYENFKPHPDVNHTLYLPIDSAKNAKKFISLCQPQLAIFIKYEIWLHYFKTLQNQKIPLVLAPAIFKEYQIYFKGIAKNLFLPILKKINQIWVQDDASLELLKKHHFTQAQNCGETRLDRVLNLVQEDFTNETVARFIQNQQVLMLGSSWEAEEKITAATLQQFPKLKVIVAPHDISTKHLDTIKALFKNYNTAFYSRAPKNIEDAQILIIDNIGMLSRLYRYATVAFIGGGFGAGLHSLVEATAYGIPVIFGPKHGSYLEPKEMLQENIGFEITNETSFKNTLSDLLNQPEKLKEIHLSAKTYISQRSGASEKIFKGIEKYLKK